MMMLRMGAENLYKATKEVRTKENVALELRFINSNLQLLREQLGELNSVVDVYQGKHMGRIPMIPLGLKETKSLDLEGPIKELIVSHFHENAERFNEAIADLMDLREAVRTPSRDSSGVSLLFRYYNQLSLVEKRFFNDSDTPCKVYFQW